MLHCFPFGYQRSRLFVASARDAGQSAERVLPRLELRDVEFLSLGDQSAIPANTFEFLNRRLHLQLSLSEDADVIHVPHVGVPPGLRHFLVDWQEEDLR